MKWFYGLLIFLFMVVVLLAAPAKDCNITQVNLVPLDVLGSNTYQGVKGGLYIDGSNTRPCNYEELGIDIANTVKPLDVNGQVDLTNGVIGVASIGMSNCNYEFAKFMQIASNDQTINPRIIFANGASGGATTEQWEKTNDKKGLIVWGKFADSLAVAGIAPTQLQVIWVKNMTRVPMGNNANLEVYRAYDVSKLKALVTNIKQLYPGVKLCYHSSRIYGGYRPNALNAEPYCYWSGFSIQELVRLRMNNAIDSPWISWGPYLWTDGTRTGNASFPELRWLCEDLANDGIHPSDSGTQKVAEMLLHFLKTDTTSAPWFLSQ